MSVDAKLVRDLRERTGAGMMDCKKALLESNGDLELAIEAGAEECNSKQDFHEIFCSKSQFYKVKTIIEKKFLKIVNSGIEWFPLNKLDLEEEQYKSAINLLEALENDDDVQNVYANLKEKQLNIQ